MTLRLGIVADYSDDFREIAEEVVEAERVGVDVVAAAEAYSFDAVSRLGYLAAVTERITLASGIMPLFSRTPTMIAMTAAGLDDVSGGRFELGLGSSGPQVIEGFHGVPFHRPLARLRETVDVCRMLWRREPVVSESRDHPIPLPADRGTGLGKPLKLINHPRRERIPIAIAALTPKAVAQAAEIAESWIPLFYFPGRAHLAWGDALDAGFERRDPSLSELDVQAQAPLLIADDTDQALEVYRDRVALYVGGMGAKGANFYNDLAVRYGFEDAAARIQELYLAGEKKAAAEAVPEELLVGTSLIGSETHVRERLQALVDSGVTTLTAQPLAPTRGARIQQLEGLRGLIDAL
ncbi:LLM class F420-dependent oxidoreductase [Schumannella sp. 10F1B-5-1]|uniref:LLM class F420-dependent oxidoreductase n=1 Tax=Schumannella sp. 10F1B-5-1 TaxID=2590780 RepID=UPI00113146DB|nr:LLM class F420-dependent oxidoreductase [Schumannella sp. 10F1B-5-1]TPW70619.1 LLM class F420-dependent oxidoreductase [Schumannella sp. 10F1B-5-1]